VQVLMATDAYAVTALTPDSTYLDAPNAVGYAIFGLNLRQPASDTEHRLSSVAVTLNTATGAVIGDYTFALYRDTNANGVYDYGVDVYVSSNCPVIETAASNTSAAFDTKAAVLAHRDTMVLAEQMAVRSQTQYKQEYLANLYTADTLYGIQTLRPETGFVLAVPA
jgi:hypothetical protein